MWQLRLRVIDPRLRGAQVLLRLIEQRPRRKSAVHQLALAIELIARLDQLPFGRGKRRLRRAQRVQFVLRIELGQHLIRLDMVADVGQPFDDAPADAEGERRLVFGLDLSGEDDRVADFALRDRDRAHRARLAARSPPSPPCTRPAAAQAPAQTAARRRLRAAAAGKC